MDQPKLPSFAHNDPKDWQTVVITLPDHEPLAFPAVYAHDLIHDLLDALFVAREGQGTDAKAELRRVAKSRNAYKALAHRPRAAKARTKQPAKRSAKKP